VGRAPSLKPPRDGSTSPLTCSLAQARRGATLFQNEGR
jgi:hypothetical protein